MLDPRTIAFAGECHHCGAHFGGIAYCTSQLSDAQHMLATQRFLFVGLPKIIHGEGGAYDRSDDASINQTRDLDQLIPVWFDDEEGVSHAWLAHPFGISRNGYQLTALAKDSP